MSEETHPMSELGQGSRTDKTQLVLDETFARHNLASFADIDELYKNSGAETAHLLRSPANAERLLTALARAQAGTTEPQSLAELCCEVGLDGDA